MAKRIFSGSNILRLPIWWYFVPSVVLIYVAAVFVNADNHPFRDDFFLFLRPANAFYLGYIPNLIDSLWYANNEHRLLSLSVVGLLHLMLEGELDFMHLVLSGNIALPVIVLLLCLYFPVHLRLGLAPFFIFFIITLQHYETMIWVTSLWQNYWVLIWLLLTFWVLNKANPCFLMYFGVFLLALATTFSSGCGLLVWPLGALLLYRMGRNVAAIAWFSVGLVVLFLYLFGLPPSYEMLHAKDAFLKSPWRLPTFGLYFLGALFKFSSLGNWWPALCGLVLIVILVYLYYSRFFKQHLLLDILVLYCLLTTLLVMINRFVAGDNFAFLSRYRITPNILWAIALAGLQIQISNLYGDKIGRSSRHLLCLVAFIFCIASAWVNWGNLKIIAIEKQDWLTRINKKECPEMRQECKLAIKLGLYKPPSNFEYELKNTNNIPTIETVEFAKKY